MKYRMRKLLGGAAVLLAGMCLAPMGASAQTEMLLPYTQPIFQSTWANPAVRPEHRFSFSIAPLSSLELGVINDAFTIGGISAKQGSKLLADPEKLVAAVREHKLNHGYAEFQADIFHFRMLWRNWNFWIGARNVSTLSLTYPQHLVELTMYGNAHFLGKTMQFSDLAVSSTNYTELTLGASKIMEKWVVGGRLSLLGGTFDAHTELKKFEVTVRDDRNRLYHHHVVADGQVLMSGIPRNADGGPAFGDFGKALGKYNYFNLRNPGLALSVAVAWKPEKNTNVTFAFSDLGFIRWGDGLSTMDLKEVDYDWTRMGDLGQMLMRRRLKWDNVRKKIEEILQIDSAKLRSGSAYTTWLSPKFHLMGTYRVARQSVVGVSLSGIVHKGEFYPSATVSFQQSYSNLIHAQVAWSYNQRSWTNVGFGVVFTPGPVQMYLISDNMLGLILPKHMRATNIRMGVNFVLGPLYDNHKLTNR